MEEVTIVSLGGEDICSVVCEHETPSHWVFPPPPPPHTPLSLSFIVILSMIQKYLQTKSYLY